MKDVHIKIYAATFAEFLEKCEERGVKPGTTPGYISWIPVSSATVSEQIKILDSYIKDEDK